MQVCFIKEIYKKYNFFRPIDLIQNDNKILCETPIDAKLKKVPINIRRLNKYLYDNCIDNIVLSKELLRKEIIKNYFYSNNMNILEEERLFKYIIKEIIELIYSNLNKMMQNSELSILLNDISNFTAKDIINLSRQLKRLNIITNNQKRFSKLEEYLYYELGIMIKVSNNKQKSLLKSEVILNVDYPVELINQYRIPSKCVIINIMNDINIEKKHFSGININSFSINIEDNFKIDGFEDKHICEALLIAKQKLPNIEITNLIGKNGAIEKKEFISLFA